MVEKLLSFPSEVDLISSFVYFLVFMCSKPGIPLEWDTLEIYIVVVDINVYEFERKVDEFEKYIYGCHLDHSSAMELINTRDQLSGIVYVVRFKIKHRQEIVSY